MYLYLILMKGMAEGAVKGVIVVQAHQPKQTKLAEIHNGKLGSGSSCPHLIYVLYIIYTIIYVWLFNAFGPKRCKGIVALDEIPTHLKSKHIYIQIEIRKLVYLSHSRLVFFIRRGNHFNLISIYFRKHLLDPFNNSLINQPVSLSIGMQSI